MKRNITKANVRTLTEDEFEYLRNGINLICNTNINTLINECYNKVRMEARLDPNGMHGNITKDVDFIFIDRCFYYNRKSICRYSPIYNGTTKTVYTDKLGYRKVMALAFYNNKIYVSCGYAPDETESIIMDIIE